MGTVTGEIGGNDTRKQPRANTRAVAIASSRSRQIAAFVSRKQQLLEHNHLLITHKTNTNISHKAAGV